MTNSCRYGVLPERGCCCQNCRIDNIANTIQKERMKMLSLLWKENIRVSILTRTYSFLIVKQQNLQTLSCDQVEML